MSRLIIIAAPLLAAAALTAAPATASTVSECQGKIDALIAATQDATFTGRNAVKDRSGMLGKLGDAGRKLDAGKPADATLKLTQFRDQAGSLAAQGKLDAEDAAGLQAGADDAIACIAAVGS